MSRRQPAQRQAVPRWHPTTYREIIERKALEIVVEWLLTHLDGERPTKRMVQLFISGVEDKAQSMLGEESGKEGERS